MKKFLRILGLTIAALLLVILGYIAIFFPPVMAGMAAKTMCSCVFVGGRTPESVKDMELQVFPGLSSADFVLNREDSIVDASILWKTSRSIFRKGLGCTLLSEAREDEVRGQSFQLAHTPVDNYMGWEVQTGKSTTQTGTVDRKLIDEALSLPPCRPSPVEKK